MARYARVDGGIVVEVIDLADGLVPGVDLYTPAFAAGLVECSAAVRQGWVYEGGELSEPPPPPPPSQADLAAYAADKRWQAETGGITVAGVPVATDDRSKTMIMGARIKADADSSYTVGWKGADGSFVSLTAPQIIAISDAVLAHVDACFAAEAAVAAAITDGTVTTTQQVDDWPWPALPT
ncbi:DUF4376 domain-containing protein [Camelimonas lactis]|uniref:Uncharacterized protein DUF4376 n=1 Tax=Camelimonas lactis TaxID=659006 RepID=A0A4R2GW59_9HYPH|nr:DUF4376 domain-containing protein [Camelimonas lactis]TCO15239.1 uncharacterized protein DUF4376 [Camelimonas lactis]